MNILYFHEYIITEIKGLSEYFTLETNLLVIESINSKCLLKLSENGALINGA